MSSGSTHDALSINGRAQTPPNHNSGIPSSTGRASGMWSASPEPDVRASLLPAFSSLQYSHLPTPLSPSDSNLLSNNFPHESPVPQSSQSSGAAPGSRSHRFIQRSYIDAEPNSRTPTKNHQILTPESSPQVPRFTTASSRQSAAYATSAFQTPSRPFPSHSSLILENSILNTPPNMTVGFQAAAAASTSPEPAAPPPSSTLSSPFMAKSTTPKRKDDNNININSTPTPTPSSHPGAPGGEMERIRQAAREDHLTHLKEAEARRPEYLQRCPDTPAEGDKSKSVGIMETPVRGRRLKLFQETSEESFEESLMAGGYGRYRTADWVRQPQPLAYPPGTPTVVQRLETVQEEPPKPPTELELKKRKRLESFRSSRADAPPRTKLYPVELEGKGRVLLDIPNDARHTPPSPGPEPSPSKKRASKKKVKKADADKKANLPTQPLEEANAKPNWPDAEFPWRLRTEERAETAKFEEEERLKIIQHWLDGGSDDEEVDEEPEPVEDPDDVEDEHNVVPNLSLLPPKAGRGKHVPLLSHPEDPRKSYQSKRTIFPTDPGDARAALMSKRSVRALSYRQQRRERELLDQEEPEHLCICRGGDDGRELVQCDGCCEWYHLECIGIRDVSELGREDDPWFCKVCLAREAENAAASVEGYDAIMHEPESEPTFVPTDNEVVVRERSSDATLYHPAPHDSPSWGGPGRTPKTPPARSAHAPHLQPPSTWSFGPAPTTPIGRSTSIGSSSSSSHAPRIFAPHTTPTAFDGYRVIEESPFDPTSTPSRGLRFSGSFSTPKTNNMWPLRPNGPLFTTPSQPTRHKANRPSFGGPGSLSAALDDQGGGGGGGGASRSLGAHGGSEGFKYASLSMFGNQEDSPVRRDASSSRDVRSPLGASMRGVLLEESPVVRMAKGKERTSQ